MPTLSPGCHLVPRWRTVMWPARRVSLPNFFTPRRLLSLSRPLRDEPPAFLCAMSNYFAFGLFFAPPLAGAAFSVEAAFAVLPPPAPALPLPPFFGWGLALASSAGGGLGGFGAVTPSASVDFFAPASACGGAFAPDFF